MRLILLILVAVSRLSAGEDTGAAGSVPDYPYPLTTCLSCGDALGAASVSLQHAGRDLKFCCIECVAPYTKSPETYISSLEEQIRMEQRDSYPLKTCVVSGHDLGSMGEPVEYVSGNTLVKFCCGACIEKFASDREQMLKKLSDARAGVIHETEPKPH
ncbi:MAG: hypothetical protein IPH10_11525 [bacterium]|nr:hypothetical protein [bacterium]